VAQKTDMIDDKTAIRYAKRLAIWSSLLIVCLLVGTCFGGCVAVSSIGYGDGEIDGIVVMLEKRGYVFSTMEVTVAYGGVAGSHTNLKDFSVTDPDVYTTLVNTQGTKVRLHYHSIVGYLPWRGSTSHFVNKVEALK
jgi:hypothetical protein